MAHEKGYRNVISMCSGETKHVYRICFLLHAGCELPQEGMRALWLESKCCEKTTGKALSHALPARPVARPGRAVIIHSDLKSWIESLKLD